MLPQTKRSDAPAKYIGVYMNETGSFKCEEIYGTLAHRYVSV